MKKKLIAALLSAAMVVSVVPVFASDAAADEETATESSTESPLAGKKIAYIMYMSSATIFQMWSDSFTATAEKLGMEASTFFCNDNADTWKSTIEQCAQGGYDGLMVSHGGQEYAYDFLSGILEQYPDLKIVTFDTPFKDANGETAKIDGVTQFFQQDAGFAESLVQAILDMYPDKTPKEREDLITERYGAVFIIGIGGKLSDGNPHDKRAPDYDDYTTIDPKTGLPGLNGDLLIWNSVLGRAIELSSMGIRVDKAALLKQLELAGKEERTKLYFHKRLLEGSLPLSIGGGIGQSRLCMLYLRKAHIGEIQASIWPEEMRRECAELGMQLI